jgi:DnaJ-class molecular chaperone
MKRYDVCISCAGRGELASKAKLPGSTGPDAAGNYHRTCPMCNGTGKTQLKKVLKKDGRP